jgi:hypothetical protein
MPDIRMLRGFRTDHAVELQGKGRCCHYCQESQDRQSHRAILTDPSNSQKRSKSVNNSPTANRSHLRGIRDCRPQIGNTMPLTRTKAAAVPGINSVWREQ